MPARPATSRMTPHDCGFFPLPPPLERSLVRMICVARTSKVFRIIEIRVIASVLFNIKFSTNDVIDINAARATTADDSDPAERVAGKDETSSGAAPAAAVVQRFKAAFAASSLPITSGTKLAVIVFVFIAVA